MRKDLSDANLFVGSLIFVQELAEVVTELVAADEVAVEAFLAGGLDLGGVVGTSGAALDARPPAAPTLEGYLGADRWARDFARTHIEGRTAPSGAPAAGPTARET